MKAELPGQSLEIKVTAVGKGLYGIRLFVDGVFYKYEDRKNIEKRNIGTECRDILRWWDKNGGMSRQAFASRCRPHKKQFGETARNTWK